MNSLAVAIAIILFPGLVATVICDKITAHTVRWDSFKYAVYSFLFGVMSYGLLQLFCHAYELGFSLLCKSHLILPSTLGVWGIIRDEHSPLSYSEVIWATLLSPLVAFAAAAAVNFKLINKFAQKIGVSQKYGDENLFSFFLNSKEVDWVYVRDRGTGLTYFGRVVSYSECASIQEVVLSEVIVYEYESSDQLYAVPLIYLSRPLGSFTIEVPSSDEGE